MRLRVEVGQGLAGLAAASGALAAWATNPGTRLPIEGELARVAVGLAFVGAGMLAGA